MSKIRAAVLMGGTSAERDISLSSARMVLGALDPAKYEIVDIDTGLPGWTDLVLREPRPEVALLILHGPGGEDGVVQGFLETAGIPYTGSGVLSSALCMDKELTKIVLQAEGIPVPHSFKFTRQDRQKPSFPEMVRELPVPLVVKPNRQGSTRGTTKVIDADQILVAVDAALGFDTEALLEEYVSGVEITACVLGGDDPQVLPLIEIVPQSGFYDYHDKYVPGACEEILPARIPDRRAEQARQYALKAHRRLKCWGMSRTDMIVGERQTWVLEVNTIPGMTPTSLLPRAAASVGLTLGDLLNELVDLALTQPLR